MNSSESAPRHRTWGVRLSSADVLILVAASAIAWWMHRAGNDMWWMVAAVVGHFFLFCNVFRIRRSLELGWAVVFVCNVGWWLSRDCMGWLPAMQYQAPVTVLVILIEMFSPSYHGIGARRINRCLPGCRNNEMKLKK